MNDVRTSYTKQVPIMVTELSHDIVRIIADKKSSYADADWALDVAKETIKSLATIVDRTI